jgi:hypothetical protein
MSLKLICAMPNPGCPGAPRGLFYDPDTVEGRVQAEEFAEQQNRAGYGVFDSIARFKDTADERTFAWVLEQNGWRK